MTLTITAFHKSAKHFFRTPGMARQRACVHVRPSSVMSAWSGKCYLAVRAIKLCWCSYRVNHSCLPGLLATFSSGIWWSGGGEGSFFLWQQRVGGPVESNDVNEWKLLTLVGITRQRTSVSVINLIYFHAQNVVILSQIMCCRMFVIQRFLTTKTRGEATHARPVNNYKITTANILQFYIYAICNRNFKSFFTPWYQIDVTSSDW